MEATEHEGDGTSTLALKPIGGVNRSPKQRAPVAPQNGDIVTVKKEVLFIKQAFSMCKTCYCPTTAMRVVQHNNRGAVGFQICRTNDLHP